ncbi:hypothetical protein ACFVTP_36475 [Streptomyces celluloflavus]|uniref:hypothetical protein n=1 Tax=Streptomyces celluloflavus TaxID=58344 RepID=UPI0036DAC08B
MQEPTSGPEPEAPTGTETAVAEPAGPAGSTESSRPAEPAGPRPLGVGITPAGDAAVDDRLRRLADADRLAVSGHLQVYEDVHRGLRDVLAALDQHPGPPAPSATAPGAKMSGTTTPGTTTHDNRS